MLCEKKTRLLNGIARHNTVEALIEHDQNSNASLASLRSSTLNTARLSPPSGHTHNRSFAEALSILERKLLPCEALVTRTALAQGQSVFEELASGQSSIMKAVFEI